MTKRAPSDVPAVLMMAQYSGTLAAVRCLGAHGVPVVVATERLSAPARWSRWTTRNVRCPPFEHGPSRLLAWLLEFGASCQGTVLYPTCDDLAWLIARHSQELSRYFHLYSPDIRTMRTILNKRTLYAACAEVGIDTPETWYPESEPEARRVARAGEAFLVKPRTQVFLERHAKGGLARGAQELGDVWSSYRSEVFAMEVLADWPGLRFPMVQRFVPATEGIHSISGFVDRRGRMLAVRGCVKVLQEPVGVGVGVCFEQAEPPPELVERVRSLCEKVGYFGVFEAEFVRAEERHLLIDFNPRYFGQMGFDIARGMPLAWMAHLSALGEEELAADAGRAVPQRPVPKAYCDHVALTWRLGAAGAAGQLNAEHAARWVAWLKDNSPHSVDAALSPADVGPGVAAVARTVWRSLRHPRSFWRSLRHTEEPTDSTGSGQ